MAEPPAEPIQSAKIRRQMERRGWTVALINETFAKPAFNRPAKNRATSLSATAYFRADLTYIVVEDASGAVIQLSDRTNPDWAPDPSIEYPPKDGEAI